MPRAIDMHVHLPTASFLEGAIGPYRAAAERFFRTSVPVREMDDVARYYEDLDIIGVLLAWDAETATGLPPVTNQEVAEIVRRYPGRFIGFASVDPWKGRRALEEVERAITELGLKGVKFHPSLQAFYPHDARFYPLYEKIAALGVPTIFHTGTSGLGAGLPGGGGIKLDYARPIYLDTVAADFPELIIIGAHTGWPWHEELLAIIGHKPNVYMDLSGWSPRYIAATVLEAARKRLSAKMLFGSDYPFITPERWLADFEALDGFSEETRRQILYENAARILNLAGSC
ncbi:MAG: amidohydrolase family protein [Blastocatellia bacterium]|nr:amidohydrolase family protein [Blastocatellia bacterium]MCX7752595.1 amidohydrolase family protein [Blastocatellia bacterium]MDW8255522.1 amidohydrolase family protein [Acidobacteriota bacterium]